MNDVCNIKVFSCADKLKDLQTDHSPSHNIHARGVCLYDLTIVMKMIQFLENLRIATVNKLVNEEKKRWDCFRFFITKFLLNDRFTIRFDR